jgi:hypothetical protein
MQDSGPEANMDKIFFVPVTQGSGLAADLGRGRE